jgi:hypothetical protein
MNILEPLMLGGVTSYVILPLATYALGFDPSLSWQYVVLFGLAPILLAAPAILPVGVIMEAIFGGADRFEQVVSAILTIVVSVVTFLMIMQWVHAPTTGFQTIALIISSPFIGGIGITLVGAAAVAIACAVEILFSLVRGPVHSKR